MTRPQLEDVFLLDWTGPAPQRGALAQELRRIVDDAAEVLRTLEIDSKEYVHWLAKRLSARGDLVAQLEQIHGADLALALGCVKGDVRALATFDRFLASLDGELAKRARGGAEVEELKQQVRERLLVARDGEPARIGSYNGSGPLRGWLRTVAARLEVDLHRQRHGTEMELDLDQLAAPGDPELDHLKQKYRAELKQAMESALGALSTRETSLLKLHFLDQMNADAIGRMYGVGARTVQRWIAAARERILDETRGALAAKLGLNRSEVRSLVKLVHSQLDVSISRFFRKDT